MMPFPAIWFTTACFFIFSSGCFFPFNSAPGLKLHFITPGKEKYFMNAPPAKSRWFQVTAESRSFRLKAIYNTLKSSSGSFGFWFSMYAFQTFVCHISAQYRVTILRHPNQVIFAIPNSMAARLIILHSLTIPLLTLAA